MGNHNIDLKITNYQKILIILLWIGALFYLFEFVLHFWGLSILEHDKIFMPTHDRYVALFALTYAALLVLIGSDLKKYQKLFYLTIIGIFASFLNGLWISLRGGYAPIFNVITLDQQLSFIGYAFSVWYVLLIVAWYLVNKEK